MSLLVDVLPLQPLPLVRLIVDLPAGRTWKVTGHAGEHEWLAGEGTSTGAEVVFSDPWAPLGVGATYTLEADGSWAAGPVVRTFEGWHALTDLPGRQVASFLWEKDGGDPWTRSPRASFAEPWGSSLPVPVMGPVAGAGGGAITARTVGQGTRVMRRLVDANRPLVLLHNEGRCRLPECDVPLARTILLTAAPENLTSRMDRAERTWGLEYRLVPRPHAYLAPVATWGDVKAHWSTSAALAASGLDVADLRRGDWLVQ